MDTAPSEIATIVNNATPSVVAEPQEPVQELPAPARPQVVEPPKPEVVFFTSSSIAQPPALAEFLKEKLSNPYNKYCLDCKKNQTTHAIVWLGVFVCKDCADLHRVTFGGNQYSYIKDVYGEQWDDYQLRSVCFGGNQALF